MFEASESPEAQTARTLLKRGAPDVFLTAFTAWLLSGMIAALGFSLGISLVRPARVGEARRTWIEAIDGMDGRWYKQIATDGYRYNPNARSNVAFFPLYPLLSSAVITFFGLRAETALLIVSNGSLLAALAKLGLYVRSRYPLAASEVACYTVAVAALFPTGCFFRLAYSESTFLLLTLIAMYAMLRRWALLEIAFFVGLATAARPVGVALLAPFAVHIVRRTRAEQEVKCASKRMMWGGPSFRRCFASSLVRVITYMPFACWGLGEFVAYQAFLFDEPLASAKVQTNWGIRRASVWREKAVSLVTLEPVWSAYDSHSPVYWRNRDPHGVRLFSLQFATPIVFAGAIALVALGAAVSGRDGYHRTHGGEAARPPARWLSLEETSLAALLLLIPYISRSYEMGLGSMGRFAAVVFPLYLVLGRLLANLPPVACCSFLALSGFFLTIYTALYAAGYAVF